MKIQWQRWKFSLMAAGVCVAMGIYTLIDAQNTLPVTPAETQSLNAQGSNTSSLLGVYSLDTLERFQFKNKERTLIARQVNKKWQLVTADQNEVFLSDFEQALLQRTAQQLKVLNAQRLLLSKPTSTQQTDMGLAENALQVKLTGVKDTRPVIKNIRLGKRTPTNTGFYLYLPQSQQVYLGYINIPEALTRLLEHA